MPEYHNVIPRTREERKAADDKDAWEKSRLQIRRGGHNKYEGSSNPVMPDRDSLSYIEESERFSTDAAGEEFDSRQRKLIEREEKYERRRQETFAREEARWNKIEQQFTYEERRTDDLKDTDKAKRNSSSVAYNPITLRYDDTHNGQVLKFQDDTIRWKAAQRAHNLYDRQSSQQYDLITGEPLLNKVKVPERPEPPEPAPEKPEALGPIRMDLTYGEDLHG